jgi:DNA repair exonuclease SbcCD ATPase subunit
MRLKSLKITNLGPYQGEHEIDLIDKDIIGVIAKSTTNARKSNQSGKSFLVEAIRWIITGESRAKTDFELVHHGEDFGEGILVIEDEDQDYVIRRGRSEKEGILEINFEDKTSKAQAAIDKLIGFDSKELDMTLFFEQGNTNTFIDLPSDKKKKYIMDWLENDYWVDIFTKANNEYVVENKELNEMKSKLSHMENTYESLSHNMKDELEKINKDIEKAEAHIQLLEEKLSKIKTVSTVDQRKTLDNRLKELRRNLDRVESDDEQYSIILHKLVKLDKEIGDFEIQDYPKSSEIEVEIGNLQRDKRDLDSKIESASELTGVCPILNQSCDRIELDKKELRSWKEKKLEIVDTIKEKRKLLEEVQEYEEQKIAIDKKKSSHADLVESSKKYDVVALKKESSNIICEIKEVKKCLEDLEEGNDPTIEIKAKIKESSELRDELIYDKAALEGKIEARQELKKNIKSLSAKITDKAVIVDDLKYVTFVFSKNGIPSQEVENAFSEIEDEINYVLSEFGTEMEVIFTADRELKDWEKSCHSCGFVFPKHYKKSECEVCAEPRMKRRKDELQIKVLKNNSEFAYYMESGGGKTILSIAIRIALARLKMRKTHRNFNVLFMDEVDAFFDDENRDKFISLVNNAITKKLGFEQVIWVSHSGMIKDSVPHVLMVVNSGRKAKVKFL